VKQSDIKDVCLVASCRTRDEARLVQQMMISCGLSNYHIRQDLRPSIESVIANAPDVALFVGDRDDAPMREFFRRVRAHDFMGNRYVPIIVALWHPSVAQIKQAINIGASEILSFPANTEALAKAIYRAVFVGRPFIDVPSYFGPDRRRKQIQNFGSERRETPWDYSHVSVRQPATVD